MSSTDTGANPAADAEESAKTPSQITAAQGPSPRAAVMKTISEGWQCCLRWEYFPIFLVVLASTILNFVLVFEWSLYKTYLTSDMFGYWERALQIWRGDEKTPNTWVSNAPFYSRVIAVLFSWLEYFNLRAWRLEAILSLNILVSAFGTFSLYMIGRRMFEGRAWPLALAATYAFAYPNLYFNTFVLGEPFAIPLIITALCMVLYWHNSYKLFFAGLLLAFGVGVRPSNGFVGLPCGLFILFYGFHFWRVPIKEWFGILFPRVLRAAVFSIAFIVMIFSILAENNRVSDGKLKGITAHSGYNFFLGQTQAHMIQANWDGLGYGFVPSSVAGNPEYGSISTTIPLYDSARYYEEGWKILKDNPHLWLDHFKKYNHLFFNNLFPAVPSVKGFNWFFDPFRHITFYMLVFCGLLLIPLRERDVAPSYIYVFGAIFTLCASALFFYTVTHQYFTNFSYALYALFFIYLYGTVRHFSKYKKFILAYIGVVLIATAGYYSWKANRALFITPKVEVVVNKNQGHIGNLDQPRKVLEEKTFSVNNLEFLQALPLKHRTTGEYPDLTYNFFMDTTTEMEVLESGTYMFTVYADDGYRLKLDGEVLMEENRLKKMNEFKLRDTFYIHKGRHTLEVDLFQAGVFSGLVVYYRRIDTSLKPDEVGPWEYLTRFGQGKFIGDDSEYTKFYLPDEASASKN